jgi:hypothetical protein
MKAKPCTCELRTFPHRRDWRCEALAEVIAHELEVAQRDARWLLACDNADRAADCNATLRDGYSYALR